MTTADLIIVYGRIVSTDERRLRIMTMGGGRACCSSRSEHLKQMQVSTEASAAAKRHAGPPDNGRHCVINIYVKSAR